MRIFTVTCPECDCDMNVDIEEADLADVETGHLVTCADCQTETEYVYDADLDDLVPADEDNEEDDEDTLLPGDVEDDEEDDSDETDDGGENE
jgi:hypothetical protein